MCQLLVTDLVSPPSQLPADFRELDQASDVEQRLQYKEEQER